MDEWRVGVVCDQPCDWWRCVCDCRQAFGKTSTASTHDMDFFLPDTGPLSNDSYRKRLSTSGGTQTLKLPKSGVEVRASYCSKSLVRTAEQLPHTWIQRPP